MADFKDTYSITTTGANELSLLRMQMKHLEEQFDREQISADQFREKADYLTEQIKELERAMKAAALAAKEQAAANQVVETSHNRAGAAASRARKPIEDVNKALQGGKKGGMDFAGGVLQGTRALQDFAVAGMYGIQNNIIEIGARFGKVGIMIGSVLTVAALSADKIGDAIEDVAKRPGAKGAMDWLKGGVKELADWWKAATGAMSSYLDTWLGKAPQMKTSMDAVGKDLRELHDRIMGGPTDERKRQIEVFRNFFADGSDNERNLLKSLEAVMGEQAGLLAMRSLIDPNDTSPGGDLTRINAIDALLSNPKVSLQMKTRLRELRNQLDPNKRRRQDANLGNFLGGSGQTTDAAGIGAMMNYMARGGFMPESRQAGFGAGLASIVANAAARGNTGPDVIDVNAREMARMADQLAAEGMPGANFLGNAARGVPLGALDSVTDRAAPLAAGLAVPGAQGANKSRQEEINSALAQIRGSQVNLDDNDKAALHDMDLAIQQLMQVSKSRAQKQQALLDYLRAILGAINGTEVQDGRLWAEIGRMRNQIRQRGGPDFPIMGGFGGAM